MGHFFIRRANNRSRQRCGIIKTQVELSAAFFDILFATEVQSAQR